MARIDELDMVIRPKTGKVVASIPQLALHATGEDVASALSLLENKKRALLEDMQAAGVPDEFDQVPVAGLPATRMVMQSGSAWQFALKLLIVVVVLSAAVLITAGLLADKIKKDLRGVSLGGHQFWTKLESELSRMADPSNDLPDAKKKKIISDLRIVVERLRPYAAELGPLFSDLRGEATQVSPPRN
jgi:hypothetical protein